MKNISFSTILRSTVAICLMAILVTMAINNNLIGRLQEIKVLHFTAACLIHLIAYFILLKRWQLLLCAYKKMRYFLLAHSYYIGLFCNNFLPSSIGGDAVRATLLYRQGITINTLLFCSVADRLIGIISTLAFCFFSLLFLTKNTSLNAPSTSQLVLLIAVIISALIFAYPLINFITQSLKKHQKLAFIQQELEKMNTLMNYFRNNIGVIISSLLLSALSTSCIILCYYVIGLSLDIQVGFSVLMLAVPCSFIVSAIPISIGGLGLREGSIVFFLTNFGTPLESASAISVTYLVLLIIISAPGGLLIFHTQRNSQIFTKQ